jgi:arylsulfatase A-like enzyme
MKFRYLVAIATVAITATLASAESKKPNVIVIIADDLGYGDLGVQGCKDIPTPNVDRLAQTGTRFTSGYVSCPYCSPTRAGLLTGRYGVRFGHEFNPGPAAKNNQQFGLSLKETTIADRFKSAGYRTALVGKWHEGHDEAFVPTKRGFDEFFGFLGGAHDYFKPGKDQNAIYRNTEAVDEKEYLTDAFSREALSFIDRNKTNPFFLYLAFNAVHLPAQATEKYLARFPTITDPKRKTYAAMLSGLDDAVGNVLSKLKESNLDEDTLIFFISDNGGPPANGSTNGPLNGQKATTWEGGIRVPYFVRWPGKLPAGQVIDQPVIQLDILPTALAAAGVEIKPEWKLDGVNLLPLIRGESKETVHPVLYWRFGKQIAIRAGDWKLVKPAGRPADVEAEGIARTEGAFLFNLKDDIGEKKDLAAANPEKVKELGELWANWNKELVPATWGPPNRKKN